MKFLTKSQLFQLLTQYPTITITNKKLKIKHGTLYKHSLNKDLQ